MSLILLFWPQNCFPSSSLGVFVASRFACDSQEVCNGLSTYILLEVILVVLLGLVA
jgi:hypothetical protein